MKKNKNRFVGNSFTDPYITVPCCLCGKDAKLPKMMEGLVAKATMKVRCLQCQKNPATDNWVIDKLRPSA